MVPGKHEGGRGGTIYCAILFVKPIQEGERKEVFRANNRLDLCIIPELTNQILAKVKKGSARRRRMVTATGAKKKKASLEEPRL